MLRTAPVREDNVENARIEKRHYHEHLKHSKTVRTCFSLEWSRLETNWGGPSIYEWARSGITCLRRTGSSRSRQQTMILVNFCISCSDLGKV